MKNICAIFGFIVKLFFGIILLAASAGVGVGYGLTFTDNDPVKGWIKWAISSMMCIGEEEES